MLVVVGGLIVMVGRGMTVIVAVLVPLPAQSPLPAAAVNMTLNVLLLLAGQVVLPLVQLSITREPFAAAEHVRQVR